MTNNFYDLKAKLNEALSDCDTISLLSDELDGIKNEIQNSYVELAVIYDRINQMISGQNNCYGEELWVKSEQQKKDCMHIKYCVSVEMQLYIYIIRNLNIAKESVVRFYRILLIDGDIKGKSLKHECAQEVLMPSSLSETIVKLVEWHYEFFSLILSYETFFPNNDVLTRMSSFCLKYTSEFKNNLRKGSNPPVGNNKLCHFSQDMADITVNDAIDIMNKLERLDFDDPVFYPLRDKITIKKEYSNIKAQLSALKGTFEEMKNKNVPEINKKMQQNEKQIPIETRVNAALFMIDEAFGFDFNDEISNVLLRNKYGDIRQSLSEVSAQLSAEFSAYKTMERNNMEPWRQEMLGIVRNIEMTLDRFKVLYNDLEPIYRSVKEKIVSDSKPIKNKVIKLDYIGKCLEVIANNATSIIVAFINSNMMTP
jgi:hypothetical protein